MCVVTDIGKIYIALILYITKTFITIPFTGATPKPLHTIRSGRIGKIYIVLILYTTKTFITIPSTGATPKPLHAIRLGRQRALAPCEQPQQIKKAKINSPR